ncbi:unnamed protein product [Lathyrus sativus]|nr:unnamed protein product [Lathyrus sativus]
MSKVLVPEKNDCEVMSKVLVPEKNECEVMSKVLVPEKNDCEVMSKALLPQDLMLYIFHLVPIYCLIDSARYVSKHWAATFNQLDSRRVRSTTGIFVENPYFPRDSYFLEFKDDAFETISLPTPPNMGYLIGTCNGIFMFSTPDKDMIYLANPILKCWLRLAPFPISRSTINFMNQCTIACVPRTAKFKVFFQDIVVSDAPSYSYSYVFYVLRVGIDNSWKEIARKEAPRNGHISWKPLYSGGNHLYWITSEGIIVFHVDKEIIVREYPLCLPLRPKPNYLWTGNHIACIATKSCCKAYQIHILDFDSGKWSLYHETGPFDYTTPQLKFLLWINHQIIFIVALSEQYIHFAYNVNTKQFTKIDHIAVHPSHHVWLHTNTLVSLP